MNATTSFRKYDHLERLGHRNTHGIEMGLVHVFPKLDGTNSSVWYDGETIQCGSRNRVLSPKEDNAGFMAWVLSDEGAGICNFCVDHPEAIVYGEWMVPHTLKTYREEVWRKFWIFDIYDREHGNYVAFDTYAKIMVPYNLDFIEPLCMIQDPTEEQLKAQVEMNTYLISEGAGLGEGVVLKNYEWRQHGNPWAKVVRNAFKEEAARTFGYAKKQGEFQVEVAIAEEFVTPELVGKTRAKVALDVANDIGLCATLDLNWQQMVEASHRDKVIPQLLGRVFHDLVTEEMWAILKKHKGATIDFKILQGRITLAVKALAEDLF